MFLKLMSLRVIYISKIVSFRFSCSLTFIQLCWLSFLFWKRNLWRLANKNLNSFQTLNSFFTVFSKKKKVEMFFFRVSCVIETYPTFGWISFLFSERNVWCLKIQKQNSFSTK